MAVEVDNDKGENRGISGEDAKEERCGHMHRWRMIDKGSVGAGGYGLNDVAALWPRKNIAWEELCWTMHWEWGQTTQGGMSEWLTGRPSS